MVAPMTDFVAMVMAPTAVSIVAHVAVSVVAHVAVVVIAHVPVRGAARIDLIVPIDTVVRIGAHLRRSGCDQTGGEDRRGHTGNECL